jgi:hypothetical protein
MKKLFLAIVFLYIGTIANAYELGNYILMDGVPSIVIYVDSTGEHGLVMSAISWNRKNLDTIKYLFATNEWANYEASTPATPNKSRPGFEDLYLSMPPSRRAYNKYALNEAVKLGIILGEKGKENAELIEQFCSTNHLHKATYFPFQAWADQLGEGWYIPGNAELELYAKFLGQKVGVKFNNTSIEDKDLWFLENPKRFELGYTLVGWFAGNLWSEIEHHFFAPITIISSTIIKSSWTYDEHNIHKIDPQIAKKVLKKKKLSSYYHDYYIFGLKKEKKSEYVLQFFQSAVEGGIDYDVVAVKEF